jgi:hypothetical protein
MREITQAETVEDSQIVRRTITMPTTGEGLKFAELVRKAAGLQNHKVKSLEMRIATKEAITFKAEFYGTAEDIAAAIAANEEDGK